MPDAQAHDQRKSRYLIALIILAFVVRAGVGFARLEQLKQDPDAYRLLAENLSTHQGLGHVGTDGKLYPTAFRPPGYPWLLSWLVVDGTLGLMPVAVLHVILGVGTVVLVFHTTRNLLKEHNAPPDQRRDLAIGLLAGALVAIDPILLNQATLVMTETLATFLVALAWWLISMPAKPTSGMTDGLGRGLLIGAALALGFLVRPVFIVWTVLILASLALDVLLRWWRGQRKDDQPAAGGKTLVLTVSIVSVMLLVVGLWTLRNQSALKKPIWATSHGGYTLLLGNNPSFYAHLESGSFGEKWDADFFHSRWAERHHGNPREISFWNASEIDTSKPVPAVSEIEDDQLAYESAKATIQRDRGGFIYSCLVRLGRLWAPMPHAGDQPNVVRYGIGLFYLTTMFAVLIGLWTLGRFLWQPRWAAAILLGVGLSGVHSVYWSNMRMRCIATPMLAVAAAVGASRLLSQEPLSKSSH